ncbi:TonB-dependent receptor [Sphingomonas sp. LHG3406-1]|uniref:TonB-dependent receptor n=1 Tax=Sphingomonas sp. LHG3406-1 TaxID=2804617 RepID=UPI00260F27EE|nr:TonB-dependent receptor [Sphingomonas sp. LHG3406-1]
MRATHVRSALFASAALFLTATPAFAQSAEQANAEAANQPPAAEATGAADDEGQDTATSEVVVTARRVEENLQRVPASVSAFNERALDRLQATDTTGLQGAVPNLNIVQGRGSSNATNIFIRGIGQPDALQTFDPAVGVYVDDVYLSRIRGNQLDLLDVERVEVLRGPQGTLYGKNTIGGAIKFVSRRPGQTPRGNVQATVGSFGQFDVRGTFSGPLTDTLAAGIAVQRATNDGLVRDSVSDRRYNNRDNFGIRGTLAFTPSSDLRIDIVGDYTKDDAKLNVGRPVNNLTTSSGGTLLVTNPVGSGSYDWRGRTTPSLPNSTKLKHRGVAGTIAYDVSPALTLKSITAYRKLDTDDFIDIDATQYEIGDVFVGVDQSQFSQEFQGAYNTERLKAVAGLYYLKEKVGSHQEAYADDLLGPLFLNSGFLRTIDDKLITRSYAAYANASYELVDTLTLSVGLRRTRETKDYNRTTSTFFSALPAFNATYRFNPPKGVWKDWSPMASIDWQVTPDALVYARVAKGFKSGGFNGRANSAAESTAYDPEKALSYEAGVKASIARRLRVSGAVFTGNYKDFQARVSGLDTDPVTNLPIAVLSVINAGKLRISGAELEAAWTPAQNLLLDTQIGYLDAEYKEFRDTRFTAFGGSRAFQTPAFSPKWTMRFGAQYGFNLGNAGSLTIGGQSRYRSRTALAIDNTLTNSRTEIAGLFQDSYWLTDARIVWEDASKRFSVGVYGNNLTDRAYKTDGQEFSSVGNIRTVYYGAPRTWQLKLTARY